MKNKSQENTLKSRLGPKNHSKLVLAVTKRTLPFFILTPNCLRAIFVQSWPVQSFSYLL